MRKNMFIVATIVAAAIGFTACSSSKAVSETSKALNREEVEVKMTKSEELAFAKNDACWYLEEGSYSVQCGNQTAKLQCTADASLGKNI